MTKGFLPSAQRWRHGRHLEAFVRSISNPEDFWGEAADSIYWYKKWDTVLDASEKPFYRWFVGGLVNTCYNALDRHVEDGRAEQVALIYDSPVTETIQKLTYSEVLDRVSRFAGVLQSLGVSKGDRVIVYMPMIPEAPIAMLACARIGAVHSVVFGGFGADELASRINDARPKIIVTASCGVEPGGLVDYKLRVDRSIELADHKPSHTIVKQRSEKTSSLRPGFDLDWEEETAKAKLTKCVAVAATDPLYILYGPGTSGQPKGIVRDNGGHLVALNWTMKNVFDIDPGDVWWAASGVGTGIGHSYVVYAPLFCGATTLLYEGEAVGTPDAGAFWRVIAQYRVRALLTTPTALRTIRKHDPTAAMRSKYDLNQFRMLFLAGERSDPSILTWAGEALERTVTEQWWKTEAGWMITANCIGLEAPPAKPASASKPAPGWDVRVLDEACRETPRGETGKICIRLPLPPGSMSTLWNNDERFVISYLKEFPGYFACAEAGYADDDGYVYVAGATDDVVNVGGHVLSTGSIEGVVERHPDVAELAVVPVADDLKGQVPLGLIVLRMGVRRQNEDIVDEVLNMVRDQIGPVAAFEAVIVIPRLPKTRSGKILRGTIQKIADNEKYRMPATIDDPDILDEVKSALEKIGYAASRIVDK